MAEQTDSTPYIRLSTLLPCRNPQNCPHPGESLWRTDSGERNSTVATLLSRKELLNMCVCVCVRARAHVHKVTRLSLNVFYCLSKNI